MYERVRVQVQRFITVHSGANGLAAPRDFQTPVAHFEDRECGFTALHKLCGQVFQAQQSHSPFDVVAWHGNYAPYKYDLARYCPVNTVCSDSHSHPVSLLILCAA